MQAFSKLTRALHLNSKQEEKKVSIVNLAFLKIQFYYLNFISIEDVKK